MLELSSLNRFFPSGSVKVNLFWRGHISRVSTNVWSSEAPHPFAKSYPACFTCCQFSWKFPSSNLKISMQIKPKRERRPRKIQCFGFFCFYYLNNDSFWGHYFSQNQKMLELEKLLVNFIQFFLWSSENTKDQRSDVTSPESHSWELGPHFQLPDSQPTNPQVFSKGCTMEHRFPWISEAFLGAGGWSTMGDSAVKYVREMLV